MQVLTLNSASNTREIPHKANPHTPARPLEIAILRDQHPVRTTRGASCENALRNALIWLATNGSPGDVAVCYSLDTGRLVFEAHWANGETLIHWFTRPTR